MKRKITYDPENYLSFDCDKELDALVISASGRYKPELRKILDSFLRNGWKGVYEGKGEGFIWIAIPVSGRPAGKR